MLGKCKYLYMYIYKKKMEVVYFKISLKVVKTYKMYFYVSTENSCKLLLNNKIKFNDFYGKE